MVSELWSLHNFNVITNWHYSVKIEHGNIVIVLCILKPVWEMAVHLAVAGDVNMMSYFVLYFFPRAVLDETWD